MSSYGAKGTATPNPLLEADVPEGPPVNSDVGISLSKSSQLYRYGDVAPAMENARRCPARHRRLHGSVQIGHIPGQTGHSERDR